MAFVAATHNEESTQLLAAKMHERGIEHDHPNVFFSQLYGMGDNISYVLAKTVQQCQNTSHTAPSPKPFRI